jgi:4-hydroxy-tetrahydrodipicolinate synthase
LPVYVNVTHSTLDGSLSIADAAANGGAAGIVLMPPYFFRYSPFEIRRWFEQFAREKPSIPTYLYNIPVFSNPFDPHLAADLLDSGCYQGIKDSSGDWDFFTTVRDRIAGRESSFLVGNDRLIVRARAAGAHGAVSGVACALPELVGALYACIESGNTARVEVLNGRLNEFIDRIDPLPTPMGIREALIRRKVKVGPHAMPVDIDFAWFDPWLEQVLQECAVA